MSTPPDQTVIDLQRATTLCDLRRFAEASALLEGVVATDPQNIHAWCLLARARLGLNESKSALQAAGTALTLAPEMEWAHRLASVALFQLRRYDESIREAREAVRCGPHVWQAYVRLAYALKTKKSSLDEARLAADRALAIAPNEAEAHLASGAVAAAAGHRGDAEAAFHQALRIDPQNSAAHNELARLSLRKGRFATTAGLADAAGGFATALRADPRAEVSKNNLDFVLRTFLARVAYFIFLDAWVAGRGGAWSGNAVARVLPFALMAIPAAFAWKFVKRLSPDLRTYLFRLITSRRMRVAVGLEALAVLCLTAAAVVPELVRPPIIGAAAASALVSRLTQVDQIKGALKGLPDRPVIGTWILWLVAVILGLFAAFGFASAVTGGGAGAAGVALAFALPCAGILYLIKRRSRKRWT